MMGIYTRGNKLWIRFRDAKGTWRDASTGYNVGQEELAQVMHDETVGRIGATTKTVKHAPPRGFTVRGFVAEWLPKRRERGLDWKADEGRLNRHVLPHIGDLSSAAEQPIAAGAGEDSLRFAALLASSRNCDEKTGRSRGLRPRAVIALPLVVDALQRFPSTTWFPGRIA